MAFAIAYRDGTAIALNDPMPLSRREFLRLAAACGLTVGPPGAPLSLLGPVSESLLDLPLAPNWQELYRDPYRYDSAFTFACAPGDGQVCRLRAFVRNGIVVRTEPLVDSPAPVDLDGRAEAIPPGPRACSRGLTFHRRIHGPYRLRHPLVRAGWKQWADDGFPPLTAELRTKYRFAERAADSFVKLTWEQAFDYSARGFLAVAKAYSGPEGEARLREQGAPAEAIEAVEGAGTRTIKAGAPPGEAGVIGNLAAHRFCTMLGLLDAQVRGVKPEQARGGRPLGGHSSTGGSGGGHVFVTGVATPDGDLDELRSGRLHLLAGVSLPEARPADAHWLSRSREHGAKIVSISPAYDSAAAGADVWVPIRPGTEAALFLGLARGLVDQGRCDAGFLARWTDFPLLVRTDTLRRLRAEEAFPGYKPPDLAGGPSVIRQGLTPDLRKRIGDFVAWDAKAGRAVAVTRDQVGARAPADLALEGRYEVNGIACATLWDLFKVHLKDYDLDTVCGITRSPKELLERLIQDVASIRPACVHVGPGVTQGFHSPLITRAAYLPVLLTGSLGRPGAGVRAWTSGRRGVFAESSWSAEDPFRPALDEKVDGRDVPRSACASPESSVFWSNGDRALVVDAPKGGRKCFTGRTHRPTPTRALWAHGADLLNDAPWAYETLRTGAKDIDMILTSDLQATATVEVSDLVLPTSSWAELQSLEMAASSTSPLFHLWKGGVRPVHDTRDPAAVAAGIAARLGEILKDARFADYWKFAAGGRTDVHLQRVLDQSPGFRGYRVPDILAGRHGEPGTAPAMFRTRPRFPFHEQEADSLPYWTDTGRLNAYCDLPEAIEAGENFIVHREGVEATPHLPNAIVSTNPFIRPVDHGIPENDADPLLRSVRNVKKSWRAVRFAKNPVWEDGHALFALVPAGKQRVRSRWGETDWNLVLSGAFGDPFRTDPRTPGAGEAEVQMNPAAARDLGVQDGDYVWVDASTIDRPFVGMKPTDPWYRQVARCKLRVRFNPACPAQAVLLSGGGPMATDRTSAARRSREDRRAISEATGYQAIFPSGGVASLTRPWLNPLRMTDSLVHRARDGASLAVGGDPDVHGPEGAPNETLVRVQRAEEGGPGGTGSWKPAGTGLTAGNESRLMARYVSGEIVRREE